MGFIKTERAPPEPLKWLEALERRSVAAAMVYLPLPPELEREDEVLEVGPVQAAMLQGSLYFFFGWINISTLANLK